MHTICGCRCHLSEQWRLIAKFCSAALIPNYYLPPIALFLLSQSKTMDPHIRHKYTQVHTHRRTSNKPAILDSSLTLFLFLLTHSNCRDCLVFMNCYSLRWVFVCKNVCTICAHIRMCVCECVLDRQYGGKSVRKRF